ncbi:MAG: ACT domain-containing protein, partial [Acidobacteriota bacterium]
NEVSLVSVADAVPEGVRAEKGFRCLAVIGPLAFDITGVVAGLSVPLAEAEIPIFVVSTFDTDYLLVRSQYLDRAIQTLTNAGFRITDR